MRRPNKRGSSSENDSNFSQFSRQNTNLDVFLTNISRKKKNFWWNLVKEGIIQEKLSKIPYELLKVVIGWEQNKKGASGECWKEMVNATHPCHQLLVSAAPPPPDLYLY